jgi:hypothetical protein
MKWLYRIFRLFRCPHKWQDKEIHKCTTSIWHEGKKVGEVESGTIVDQHCPRCGNWQQTRLTVGGKDRVLHQAAKKEEPCPSTK